MTSLNFMKHENVNSTHYSQWSPIGQKKRIFFEIDSVVIFNAPKTTYYPFLDEYKKSTFYTKRIHQEITMYVTVL